MPAEKTTTALKKQTIFIVNGMQYLGTIKKEGSGGYSVTDAYKFSSSDEEEIFLNWCAAKHAGDLEEFEIDTDNITRKKLSEKQQLLADAVAARADYAVDNAVRSLEKTAILNS